MFSKNGDMHIHKSIILQKTPFDRVERVYDGRSVSCSKWM